MTESVTVVMTCLDSERFVEEAIESVLAQTYRDWRLVVVDDGSEDGTPGILTGYAERCPDRIFVVTHPGNGTRGMSVSRNLAVRHSGGKLRRVRRRRRRLAPREARRAGDDHELVPSGGHGLRRGRVVAQLGRQLARRGRRARLPVRGRSALGPAPPGAADPSRRAADHDCESRTPVGRLPRRRIRRAVSGPVRGPGLLRQGGARVSDLRVEHMRVPLAPARRILLRHRAQRGHLRRVASGLLSVASPLPRR